MKHINPAQIKLNKIRQIVRDYLLAMDQMENSYTARGLALRNIQDVVGLPWIPGEELKRRKKAEGTDHE